MDIAPTCALSASLQTALASRAVPTIQPLKYGMLSQVLWYCRLKVIAASLHNLYSAPMGYTCSLRPMTPQLGSGMRRLVIKFVNLKGISRKLSAFASQRTENRSHLVQMTNLSFYGLLTMERFLNSSKDTQRKWIVCLSTKMEQISHPHRATARVEYGILLTERYWRRCSSRDACTGLNSFRGIRNL